MFFWCVFCILLVIDCEYNKHSEVLEGGGGAVPYLLQSYGGAAPSPRLLRPSVLVIQNQVILKSLAQLQ